MLESGFEATGRLPHLFLTMYLVYVFWEVSHSAHVEVEGQLARTVLSVHHFISRNSTEVILLGS